MKQYEVPEGFEVVNDVPEGFELVEDDAGVLQQAGLDFMNALKYSGSRLGALANAGLANLNEAVGVDSSLFRENQQWWQDSAKEADMALNKTYGDSPIMKTMVKEAYNPINYVGGGLKAVPAVVGATTAGDIATQGDRSGMTLQDATRVADDASMGLVLGKAIDSLMQFNPKRALLGDDVRSPKEIQELKQLSKEYGVELTPATVTGSPNLARTEYSISEGLGGGLGMNQALNTERQGIQDAIVKQLDSMGASSGNLGAGEMFKQSLNEVRNAEKDYFRRLYSSLFSSTDDKVFSIQGLKDRARQIVDESERVPILKDTQVVRDAKKILDTDDELTWDDWQKLKSYIGAKTDDKFTTGSADKARYKQLYSMFDEDLGQTAESLGGSSMKRDYDIIRDEYRDFKNLYDGKSQGSKFLQSIAKDKVNPEALGHMINVSSNKARSALQGGGYDKAGIPNAKKLSATDVLMSSKYPTSDDISLNRFLKYSNRDGFREIAKADNAKDFRVTGDNIPARNVRSTEPVGDLLKIEDLRTISNAINRKKGLKNTSKTAQYNMMNNLKMMSPFELAKYVAKDIGLSALYRSQWFREWLESGIISPAEYKALMNARRVPNSALRNTAVNSLLGLDNN